MFIIIIICKSKYPESHLFTLSVSLLAIIEFISWILLFVIEILALKNGHQPASYGVICLVIALVLGVGVNMLHLGAYHKYFKRDNFFVKWLSKQNHYCSTISILSISSIISFKIFRFCYSKFLSKSNFCL